MLECVKIINIDLPSANISDFSYMVFNLQDIITKMNHKV
jgi:hypothetical protein